MTNKTLENHMFDCCVKILQDKDAKKDVKWFCILKMLHEELISIHKAFELCEAYGLTRSNYWQIEDRFMKLWNQYWEDKNI